MYKIKTFFIFSCIISIFVLPGGSLWGMGEQDDQPNTDLGSDRNFFSDRNHYGFNGFTEEERQRHFRLLLEAQGEGVILGNRYAIGQQTIEKLTKKSLTDTAKNIALNGALEGVKIFVAKRTLGVLELLWGGTLGALWSLFQDHSRGKLVESAQYMACLKSAASSATYKATRTRFINSLTHVKKLGTPEEVAAFQQIWADASALDDTTLTTWIGSKFCALTNQGLPKEFERHEHATLKEIQRKQPVEIVKEEEEEKVSTTIPTLFAQAPTDKPAAPQAA